MLETVDDVIEALGGSAAVASLLGFRTSAVSNWKERGRIPAGKFQLISEALEPRGLRVALSVFGFSEART